MSGSKLNVFFYLTPGSNFFSWVGSPTAKLIKNKVAANVIIVLKVLFNKLRELYI